MELSDTSKGCLAWTTGYTVHNWYISIYPSMYSYSYRYASSDPGHQAPASASISAQARSFAACSPTVQYSTVLVASRAISCTFLAAAAAGNRGPSPGDDCRLRPCPPGTFRTFPNIVRIVSVGIFFLKPVRVPVPYSYTNEHFGNCWKRLGTACSTGGLLLTYFEDYYRITNGTIGTARI